MDAKAGRTKSDDVELAIAAMNAASAYEKTEGDYQTMKDKRILRKQVQKLRGFASPIIDADNQRRISERDATTPAAAPESQRQPKCMTCNGWGVIGGSVGQTAESFEQVSEPCPDCKPPQRQAQGEVPKLGGDQGMNSTPHVLLGVAQWHRRMNLELSGKGDDWAAKEMWECPHGRFATNLEALLEQANREATQPPHQDRGEGLPAIRQAFFDEFGASADDRVWDYGRRCWDAALTEAKQQEKTP